MKKIKLWTIQPLNVLDIVFEKEYFITDENQIKLFEFQNFKIAYDFIVAKMKEKNIDNPYNATYPIWAWYRRENLNKKPDLRRSGYGEKGKIYACIELELNEDDVLLSDIDGYNYVLNNDYFPLAKSEEEYNILYVKYKNLNEYEKEKIKIGSWNNIFDVEPFENDWLQKGYWVQATFWTLKKENIKDIRIFKAR